MIDLPNLDDQRFEDIVSAALIRVSTIYPEWTDFNEHDPGVTLIQLFAWLKEMQQYYLNRITQKNTESMLKLLNINAISRKPSQLVFLFRQAKGNELLTKGTKILASNNLVYECEWDSSINDYRIQEIFINTDNGIACANYFLKEKSLKINPFGKDEQNGKCFYIGIDKLNNNFSIYFEVADDYYIKRNPFDEEEYLPRKIIWEYGTLENGKQVYKIIENVKDYTHCLAVSGVVEFDVNIDDFKKCEMDFTKILGIKNEEKLNYWIRARLAEKGCEESTTIIGMYENSIPVVQKKYLSKTIFATIDKESYKGKIKINWGFNKNDYKEMVFIQTDEGWILINDINLQWGNGVIYVKFSLENINISKNYNNIKIVFVSNEFIENSLLSIGKFITDDEIDFAVGGKIIFEEFNLMIENFSGYYEEYVYVKDVSKAGAYDKVFSYDEDREVIIFGDNEHGEVPFNAENGVVVSSCVVTECKGETRNIDFININGNVYEVENIIVLEAGRDTESIYEASIRAGEIIDKRSKAVTSFDYETIALQTPSLRVLHAKALYGFDLEHPTMQNNTDKPVISIVALPFNQNFQTTLPMPSEEFLSKIKKHVEKHKMINTKINIIKPIYVEISIYCEILIENIFQSSDIEIKLKKRIKNKLSINKKESVNLIGNAVRESFIIGEISNIEGIVKVGKVILGHFGNGATMDYYGNIIMARNALPIVRDIEIRFDIMEGGM